MADQSGEAKRSYPYMSPAVFNSIRARLRQSRPSGINHDWLASVLGISEKAAKNLMPQLRTLGLVGADGSPTAIADDLRIDESYAAGCREILEATYPTALREAFDSADADLNSVANWFIRNAKTGERMAQFQARLYLHLLKAELPTEQEKPKSTPAAPPRKRAAKSTVAKSDPTPAPSVSAHVPTHQPQAPQSGPALHVDVQIHIAADASETQIETIFASMAKHLYGR